MTRAGHHTMMGGMQRIQWLGFTGTQCVDTGIVPNANTDVEAVAQMTDHGYINTVVCGGTGYRNNELLICHNLATSDSVLYEKGSDPDAVRCRFADIYDFGIHKYSIVGNAGYFDSSLLGNWSTTALSTSYAVFIGAYNRSGSVNEFLHGRIFSVKFWQAGVLVRDFVPVRSGSAGGLLDRVTHTLFGNAGSGSFVCGPDGSYQQGGGG